MSLGKDVRRPSIRDRGISRNCLDRTGRPLLVTIDAAKTTCRSLFRIGKSYIRWFGALAIFETWTSLSARNKRRRHKQFQVQKLLAGFLDPGSTLAMILCRISSIYAHGILVDPPRRLGFQYGLISRISRTNKSQYCRKTKTLQFTTRESDQP